MNEKLRRFGQVKIFPCRIRKVFNKFERLCQRNAMVPLAFFCPSLQKDQLPRVLIGHPPNRFKGHLVDWDTVINSDNLEPSVSVCDEDVFPRWRVGLSDK
jgi:hypothetical protein